MDGILNQRRAAPAQAATVVRVRERLLWTLAALLVLGIVAYHSTFLSMVQIWLRSETFRHGFMILPVSAFLVWRRWPVLRRTPIEPFVPGAAAMLAVSGGWWACSVLGIQVGTQFMAVALLPLVVLTLAGVAFTKAIAFPLAWLFFAVPFGEAAIPYLVDFTAAFTVGALQITGIPVLREGAFFSIPSGSFEVAKACSGIRYVLASLAIGTFYAHVIFDRRGKQLLFLLLALLLPILANGLRAYGIVLIAHYSDMRLAVGIDHIIYGWIFFGLVMLLMFWVGSRFADERTGEPSRDDPAGSSPVPPVIGRHGGVAVAAVLALLAGPLLGAASAALPQGAGPAGIPVRAGDWQATGEPPAGWQPDYEGVSSELSSTYRAEGRSIDLAVLRYDSQRQGAELASSTNAVADRAEWGFGQISERHLDSGRAAGLAVRETELRGQGAARLVWSWHEVDGHPVAGNLQTKWREALGLLSFRRPVSAAVLVSVTVTGDADDARDTLGAFVDSAWESLHDCLYGRAGADGACLAPENPAGTGQGSASTAENP